MIWIRCMKRIQKTALKQTWFKGSSRSTTDHEGDAQEAQGDRQGSVMGTVLNDLSSTRLVTVTSSTYSHKEGKEMSHVLEPSIRQVQRQKILWPIAQIRDPFWKISWDSRKWDWAQSRLQHMLAMLGFPILPLKKNKSPREMTRASKLWKGTQVPDKWLPCECILYWLTPDSKITIISGQVRKRSHWNISILLLSF